ncbi:MAG: SDR family oxidoreductase [Vicinamibacterales bacterium]|jgi:NAD(P)-dependent dehydrogenase (short-subunit alcohol dehydrogenase family)
MSLENPADKEPKPPFPEQKIPKPGLESELTPRPRYLGPDYRPAAKLAGQVALITGGDSGIGRSVAVLYAREGANVAITALPAERGDAQETRAVVEQAGRRCLILEGNLAERAFAASAVERTVEEFGRLDILVHNAAHQNHWQQLEDVPDEEWEMTFRVNVHAYFWLVKAALPHLKPGAAIIASGSQTGIAGSGPLPAYSTTKGAIHTFTKTLSQLLLERGIRVNCVAPGPVWTPLNAADRGRTAEEVSTFGSHSPIGRPAQPEEVAPAYVFLASAADSNYITGEVVNVLGGTTVAG